MKEIEVDASQLQTLIRDTVQAVLREKVPTGVAPVDNKPKVPQSEIAPRPVAGHVLVAVCCGECLRPETQAALEEIKHAGFVLIEPGAHELKDKATRERLIGKSNVILLPAVGDDDAAKMALGIFDEPVSRTALAALALGKPVFMAMQSPYDAALKTRAPVLRTLWEGYRRTLSGFGFTLSEVADIAGAVQNEIMPVPIGAQQATRKANSADARRVVVTAEDIEAAARNGARLQVPPGALITPLARDRARELGVKI